MFEKWLQWRGAVALAALLAGSVQGASSTVVISQVYGGAGNPGATYRNDFIELHNRGASPVSITGWSVQYAGAGSFTWNKTDLVGVIQPGQYWLIQEGTGAFGSSLPTPDTTGTIAMNDGSGKVALVTNVTLISGPCPGSMALADLVAYGSESSCFRGSGPAPAPGATTSVQRADNGCADTTNNAADFFAAAPIPRNSSAPLVSCQVLVRPVFTFFKVEGNKTFTATFTADPQLSNTVHFSTNLVSWHILPVILTNSGAVFGFADTNASSTPRRSYRVLSQ